MKIITIVTILMVGGILIGLNSCEEDNPNVNRPLMTALVEGSTWRCPEPNARVSENQIIVYGTSAEGQTIQLTVFAGEKGVYTLNAANMHEGTLIPNTSAYATIYSTSYNDGGSGQVRISSINEDDRTISGNFNFRAYKEDDAGNKTVTNGEFTKVPYKYINTVDTTQINNILTANIDGTDFTATSVVSVLSEGIIEIKGTRSDSFQSITLFIPEGQTTGIFNIDPVNGPIMANYQSSLSPMPATVGSCTIAEHDTETNIIRGTFFYNIDDDGETIELQNGYFEVQYVEDNP
ncbi:MAG: DUF6252 family protein [Bacteroidota bacterium]|nr:DUF6252 family protein [Bacteroidota bacterium]